MLKKLILITMFCGITLSTEAASSSARSDIDLSDNYSGRSDSDSEQAKKIKLGERRVGHRHFYYRHLDFGMHFSTTNGEFLAEITPELRSINLAGCRNITDAGI